MKFYLYGMGGVEHRIELMTQIANERGHTIVGPDDTADVVFMMLYPRLLNNIPEAAYHGKTGKCVVALRAGMPDYDVERNFFRTQKVMDIVSAPNNEKEARQLFAALETGDTSHLS
ncbi:MAG: hypothetical protein ACOZAO_00770 [Patescibacteria group bacterium]